MNSKNSHNITTQTTQQLSDGTTVSLTFHYPANFKIGDIVYVSTSQEVMQLFKPQHQEGCYAFDLDVWDDQIRLHCDSIKELENYSEGANVFSFKIREIELFASRFPVAQRAESYN